MHRLAKATGRAAVAVAVPQTSGAPTSAARWFATEPSGKVANHNVEKSPITAHLWNERLKQAGSVANLGQLPPPMHLLDKGAADSRLSVRYNFSTDLNLRDAYVDVLGNVLMGKLLEDLDALAGNVAFTHCDDNNPATRPLSLVTASVDRITQTKQISASDDIVLVGQVAWVGKSSLDVVMEIHRASPGTGAGAVEPVMIADDVDTRLLSSMFTYVARDRVTGKSCEVNRYLPSDADAKALFVRRERVAAAAKAARSAAVAPAAAAPTHGLDAVALVERGHAMEDMPALRHSHAVLMKHTGLENSLLCQPQNVNTGGKVFGGFLMHRAFSLAEATAYLFAGARPTFLEVDRIEFRKPVDIGDLVRLKSRVLYSSSNVAAAAAAAAGSGADKVVLVEVICQIVRPEKAASLLSNRFHFVFKFPADNDVVLKEVLPTSVEEAHALIRASAWNHHDAFCLL